MPVWKRRDRQRSGRIHQERGLRHDARQLVILVTLIGMAAVLVDSQRDGIRPAYAYAVDDGSSTDGLRGDNLGRGSEEFSGIMLDQAGQMVFQLSEVQADAWGQPILRFEHRDRVVFRSRGADELAYTADDLVALVGDRGRAVLHRPAIAVHDKEVEATEAALRNLATDARRFQRDHGMASRRSLSDFPRVAVAGRQWVMVSMRVDGGGARAPHMVLATAPPALPAQPVALPMPRRASVAPDPQTRVRRSPAPLIGDHPLETAQLILRMGSVHKETQRIAFRIMAAHRGAWPAAPDGQSYVPADEAGVDPWGGPYRYTADGLEFHVRSAGPDGAWDTADDPVLTVYHNSTMEFQPHWQAGDLTVGLNAVTGQLNSI